MKSVKDIETRAFFEILNNNTITAYTIDDGVETRRAAADMHLSFGRET